MSAAPTLGLIGGTGLTRLDESLETLHVTTPYGEPSAPLSVVETEPVRLLFLPRHGNPHRFPPHCVNYRANMWALKEAGATQVLAVSAVGGIGEAYAPGTLAVSDQLVDFTWGREHTYHDSPDVPLVHVDFTHPTRDRYGTISWPPPMQHRSMSSTADASACSRGRAWRARARFAWRETPAATWRE
jgi:5'-methylthioinosine phosphorylase